MELVSNQIPYPVDPNRLLLIHPRIPVVRFPDDIAATDLCIQIGDQDFLITKFEISKEGLKLEAERGIRKE